MALNSSHNGPLYVIYDRVVRLWERFCERHTVLFEKTCDEYLALLSSDVERLETVLKEKESLIDDIRHLEDARRSIINELNTLLPDENVRNAGELISLMKRLEMSTVSNVLGRLNLLLIDIIERIQGQNKKNQVFLNKAILSLRDMKNNFSGKKSYTTYNASGASQNVSVR